MREFFSVNEIAKLLNVSHSAVLYHIKAGNLKSNQVGKVHIISRDDFADFLKSQKNKSKKKKYEDLSLF
ncbi:MAG: helix-turn-helix domain-containing protein [Ignavibacterium sp.]|nr:helix-turn-helix domain-containing protein [Ignavibacterium sp.]MCX7610046.1 helix-turn-helix domain-containing protein [Ignavibacterium sp.]MDW8376145.1 helix-turn-helix domain-containing protein [Ignavibacteriales bacterium]